MEIKHEKHEVPDDKKKKKTKTKKTTWLMKSTQSRTRGVTMSELWYEKDACDEKRTNKRSIKHEIANFYFLS